MKCELYSGTAVGVLALVLKPTCALPLASVHLVREPGVASWNTAAPFPLAIFPAKVQLMYAARLALHRRPGRSELRRLTSCRSLQV